MVSIELKNDTLTICVEGIDKLLAMRSTISIPLSHVKRVTTRPDIAALSNLPYDVRFWGVQSSGSLLAGTLFLKGGYVFCDLQDPEKSIAIELEHDTYSQLLVQPSRESPEEAKARIDAALAPSTAVSLPPPH